jgi:hypothetical protein
VKKEIFSRLQSEHGSSTELSFCEDYHDLPGAINRGEIDAVIVGCETGFSEFGGHAEHLAQRLGIDYQFMRKSAEWNRFTNERVSLLSFSGPERSRLRSLVLLPYGGAKSGRGCKSYRRFESDLPSRDFYYNVAYEAFRITCEERNARRIWMMNPAAPWSFHEDIATCVCEALAHFCDGSPDYAPELVVFGVNPESRDARSEGMRRRDLVGVRLLNAEGRITRNRPIQVEREIVRDEMGNAVTLAHLDWWTQCGTRAASRKGGLDSR